MSKNLKSKEFDVLHFDIIVYDQVIADLASFFNLLIA